jgi:hypothetical protein
MLPVSLDCFCVVCLRLVYTMLQVSLDCFVCLRLVYPMLPVSLDCQLLIAPLCIRLRLFQMMLSYFCHKSAKYIIFQQNTHICYTTFQISAHLLEKGDFIGSMFYLCHSMS